MKWNAAHAASAVLALALTAALAGQTHAGSCEGSDRIDHDDADCLHADWDNNYDGWSSGKVWAWSNCEDRGTVVAKVDLKAAKDLTWYIKSSKKFNKKLGPVDVRNVWCCADLSDLCNESEVNDADCLAEFHDSSAADTCSDEIVTAPSDDTCNVQARCKYQYDNGDYSNAVTGAEITTSFSNTSRLHNCDAVLQVGSGFRC